MSACASGYAPAADHASGSSITADLAAHDVHVRVRRQEVDLGGQALRPRHVVGVEDRHERRAGALERGVARRRRAGVDGQADEHDAGVAEAGTDLGRAVGRRVVDDDDLEVAEGLVQEAAERPRHVGLGVARRHDDAHLRRRRPRGRPRRSPSGSCRRRGPTQTATDHVVPVARAHGDHGVALRRMSTSRRGSLATWLILAAEAPGRQTADGPQALPPERADVVLPVELDGVEVLPQKLEQLPRRVLAHVEGADRVVAPATTPGSARLGWAWSR